MPAVFFILDYERKEEMGNKLFENAYKTFISFGVWWCAPRRTTPDGGSFLLIPRQDGRRPSCGNGPHTADWETEPTYSRRSFSRQLLESITDRRPLSTMQPQQEQPQHTEQFEAILHNKAIGGFYLPSARTPPIKR